MMWLFPDTQAIQQFPTGKKILGGGYATNAGIVDLHVYANGPVLGTDRDGWTVSAGTGGSETTPNPWSLTVYAICANVAP